MRLRTKGSHQYVLKESFGLQASLPSFILGVTQHHQLNVCEKRRQPCQLWSSSEATLTLTLSVVWSLVSALQPTWAASWQAS